MAKIRHVAYMVKDPVKMLDWYQRGFGFEECYSSEFARMALDGLFNIALIRPREGESEVIGTHRADGGEANQKPGINHFGFVVDSVEATLDRLDSSLEHGENPQDGRPAEMRVYDHWGNAFDLAARGYFGREEKRLPAVRQVVLQADRPGEVAEFYKSALELEETGRAPDGSVILSDGYIRFDLVEEGIVPKTGIQYIGIQIDDWAALEARFKAMGEQLPRRGEHQAELRIHDPEGNLIVLSEKGWD